MSEFNLDELEILSQRGFKPAPGYNPIKIVKSHNISYTGYGLYNTQTADTAPPVLLDLGLYGNAIQGDVNGVYDCWFADQDAGNDGSPAGAKGIRATVTNPTIDGSLRVQIYVQFINEAGIALSGGECTITSDVSIMGGHLIPLSASNCYLTVTYREDITPNRLMFGLKYYGYGQSSMPPYEYHLYTPNAVLQGVEGTYVPNEPWYHWYYVLKNDNWYDPESAAKESTTGGGGGALFRDCDYVGIPSLPSLDICNSNFVSLYQVSDAALSALGIWMWDPSWESSLIKNVTDPMQNIISFSAIPLSSELNVVADTIQIGNKKSAISANKLTASLIQKDMGTIDITEMGKAFYDYSPFTKLQIYLPYIGKRELNPDDYMNGKIHLVYQIDCYTGQCIAHLQAIKNGKTYVVDSYNGNVLAQYPLTGANYLSAYQASINGLMTMMSGAMSGSPASVLGGAMDAVTAKPTYEKSGTLTGASGRYGVKTPYVFFDTPQMIEAQNYRLLHGYPSNTYEKLSDCKGFTQIKYIDVSGIELTDAEKQELISLLESGVYINNPPTP